MSLERALSDVVGPRHVIEDPAIRAGYERDWTGRFGGSARAVVRPADTAQVAGVLAACHAARAPGVPQGGNTALVGGGVPRDGEIVLSLARLTAIEDDAPGTIVAGAGATLAGVQAHA